MGVEKSDNRMGRILNSQDRRLKSRDVGQPVWKKKLDGWKSYLVVQGQKKI